MKENTISDLFIYPVKSTKGIQLESSNVENIGLEYDRIFAIVDAKNQVMTARENLKLLKFTTTISNSKLTMSFNGGEEKKLRIDNFKSHMITAKIFKDETVGQVIDDDINKWLTNNLGESSRLMIINTDKLRGMKEKYNGRSTDKIAFSDMAPIHLVSEASLEALNAELDSPITIHQFRPNIVIKGCSAFEEDTWSQVMIGDCVFKNVIETARCNLITVNPKTAKRDPNQEPLRTLARMRTSNGKVNFGIYLVPIQLGMIKRGDQIVVV